MKKLSCLFALVLLGSVTLAPVRAGSQALPEAPALPAPLPVPAASAAAALPGPAASAPSPRPVPDATVYPPVGETPPAVLNAPEPAARSGGFLAGNRSFPNFIGFLSNPTQAIDPRALTQITPV